MNGPAQAPTAPVAPAPASPMAGAAPVATPTPAPAPVAAPVAPVAPTPTPIAAPQSTWTTDLTPDLQNYVTSKGFKSPTSVLESYVNLEKLHGVPSERILKVPEKSDDPAWGDIYSKLGRPGKAEDYGFQVAEGGNEAMAKWAMDAMFEAGLSHSQAQKIFNGFTEREAGQLTEDTQAYNVKVQEQENVLKKEWGAAYEKNIATASKAANTFGIDAETLDKMENAMGFDGLMRHLQNVGSKLGEDAFVGGNAPKGFGAMTPDHAQSRIKALRGDKSFISRYQSGDIEARQEMEELHKMAYPSS